MGSKQFTHAPVLDGMRATAILIVMVSHTGLGSMVPGGFGVTIFFFLSGYLITSLLRMEADAKSAISLGGFYFRRALRILPPLFITIAVAAIMVATGLVPDAAFRPAALIWDYLFLTNYAYLWGTAHGAPIPLWSLDVEEHFYMLFPLLYSLVLLKKAGASAARICLLICALILLCRALYALTVPDLGQIYYWTHTRIDSILFGCCLALWQNPLLDEGAWRPKLPHLGIALLCLVVGLVYRDPIFRETVRYSLQGAALFVVFSYVLHDRGILKRILGSAPLRVVALLSYTLYLIHFPVFEALHGLMAGSSPLVGHSLAAALSFAYAGAMYLLVERPIGRWRRSLKARTAEAGQHRLRSRANR